MAKENMPAKLYPAIESTRITNPNRFYAFPLLGFLVKVIILIPQFIELMILGIAAFFLVIVINPFVVLFTGKYWDPAYQLSAGMIRLAVKISFFIYGLTNKYPGFDFTITDNYKVDIVKPEHPNRFFAIPLLGGLIRLIMLIPFMIYEGVIRYAAVLGMMGASFPVLFKGYYPESSYELSRDAIRLNVSQGMFMSGLSDSYPNFWISMNHKTIKIILIVLAVLFMIGNWTNAAMHPRRSSNYYNNQYDNRMMQQYNNDKNTNPADLKTGY